MSEPTGQFRVVLRGYEPALVDRRLEELSIALHEAARQRDQLALLVEDLQAERARETEVAPAAPATFEHLGERVAQILGLAEEEAADLRRTAAVEVAAQQGEIADEADRVREEADRYAVGVRSDAETEAARVVEDARRLADERLDSAERDAAARLQEAEAIYEDQRARSAKVAADFETTLAARRKTAETEFAAQLTEANTRLEQASRLVDEARAEAERISNEASSESRRLLDEARLEASAIVNDAKALATRVRADSDRELAAATQRRDSINAQLANVRQMLATLTGTTPVGLDALDAEVPGQPLPPRDRDLVDAPE